MRGMMNEMSFARWISNIITGVLVVVLVITMVFAISSKRAGGAPRIFGYELMTVLSGSMEPSIRTGSIIAVLPAADPTRYKAGDVITYRSPEDKNILITHRILEVQRAGAGVRYVTKGDNNDGQDPKPVPAVNIVGQYSGFTVPLLGYVVSFARSKTGILIMLIGPGLLLIGWQLISVWRIISGMENPKEKEANRSTAVEKQP